MSVRDPRAEAQALLEGGLQARVLEPSPPASTDPQWLADDPVRDGGLPGDGTVAPVPLRGGRTWDQWLAGQPEHAGWAADRWLGARRRLVAPPPAFAATRLALHRVAVYAVSPARRRANGKIGLRFTMGGFGTPFYGNDEQVRIEGDRIVRQFGPEARGESLTTLAGAAALALGGPPDLAGAEGLDVPSAGDPDAPLDVDPAAARLLGDWYGFAWSVLEEMRAEPASAPAGRTQLWPEHFDAAVDLGPDGPARATYGASPGDAAVDEPYLYVLPSQPSAAGGGLWNATSFTGAILRLGEFLDAADQRAAALAFLRARRDALAA
ncbi:MAG TPA: hypothetical protein VK951_01020 [Miltoncostaeaceae bacterium]|nr:hypothetical protein [Miltoncostaeaceae bacterium]